MGRGTVKTRVLVGSGSSGSFVGGGAPGDRVREAGIHDDVGALHARVREQVHARAVDERVVVRPGEGEGSVGQLGGERRLHVAEAGEVVRVEANHEPIGDQGAIRRGEPLGLHRALDPPLQLDGLQAGSKQASGWSLEEAFEEPLDGGQRWHGRCRSLPEGRRGPVRPLSDHP